MTSIYPGIFQRVKAVVIDWLVLVLFMMLVTFPFSFFENVPNEVCIAAFVFIFILYDPLFTSIFGGTIGHLIIGLRVVKSKDESQNIFFPFAVIRFVLKTLLGWVSLLTVRGSNDNKAIHDSVVGSIVVFR